MDDRDVHLDELVIDAPSERAVTVGLQGALTAGQLEPEILGAIAVSVATAVDAELSRAHA